MNTKQLIKLGELNFTNRLNNFFPEAFINVQGTPLTAPVLLHSNLSVMSKLDLDPYELKKASFLKFLNADLKFEGPFFGASYYSGHQFGYYVPRLGDGRALMLGEVQNSEGHYFELQLKGAGRTPFSRSGDGRAVVRSSIREYLASAHLKALSIPTTEALAVIHGDDDIYRETIEKSAVVLRVAESFLRFGHFQYYAHTNQFEELKILLQFTIENYFQHFSDHPNRYVLFFQEVVKRTAKLFAAWQAVGFCHGVLNTDNMSILGLTLDYGPYGFLDHFDLGHICNHSDNEGRYSFGNQPAIGQWNLEQLAIALKNVLNESEIKRTLESYPLIFQFEYRRIMKEKLGLVTNLDGDDEFIKMTLKMLGLTKIDYTEFFRSLSHYQTTNLLSFPKSDDLTQFIKIYNDRLLKESSSKAERSYKMLRINPKFILRNYLAQMAIDNYLLDPSLLSSLFDVLTNPFEEWTQFESWAQATPPQYKNLTVSCSS
jgi:uncharacterized protein YdiU (UPF0061 family)